MTTTQQDKGGGAKSRQRTRKTDQKARKAEKAASTKRDRADQAEIAKIAAPIEQVTVDRTPVEQAIVDQTAAEKAPAEQAMIDQAAVEQAPVEQALTEATVEQAMVEQAPIDQKVENGAVAAALSGEVLLPEIRTHVAAQPLQAIGLQAIAAAYVDYARRSWAAGRMLAEKLMAARSLEQAVEAHGNFARQTHANFLAHSQKLCELYVDSTRQFFRPWETFTTQWTRFGR